MSELPDVSVTVRFPSAIPGKTVALRVKKAINDRGDHLRYIERFTRGGIFPGQNSNYPYKRFRVSAPDGGPIVRLNVYTAVLVSAFNWPSDDTHSFSAELIAERIEADLAEFADALATA